MSLSGLWTESAVVVPRVGKWVNSLDLPIFGTDTRQGEEKSCGIVFLLESVEARVVDTVECLLQVWLNQISLAHVGA